MSRIQFEALNGDKVVYRASHLRMESAQKDVEVFQRHTSIRKALEERYPGVSFKEYRRKYTSVRVYDCCGTCSGRGRCLRT
jgi:hypothetical protein